MDFLPFRATLQARTTIFTLYLTCSVAILTPLLGPWSWLMTSQRFVDRLPSSKEEAGNDHSIPRSGDCA